MAQTTKPTLKKKQKTKKKKQKTSRQSEFVKELAYKSSASGCGIEIRRGKRKISTRRQGRRASRTIKTRITTPIYFVSERSLASSQGGGQKPFFKSQAKPTETINTKTPPAVTAAGQEKKSRKAKPSTAQKKKKKGKGNQVRAQAPAAK